MVKKVREGGCGTMTGKISYPFLLILLEAKLLCSVSQSYIICVHTLMCNPQCCQHLGNMFFTLTAKGIMPLGWLLYPSCCQHFIMDFPKGSCYQHNYSHFTEDITATESLPIFWKISHVNYRFSSGVHWSIYSKPFTLLFRTTLLKTYFKAHFKSCWLKSLSIWLSD